MRFEAPLQLRDQAAIGDQRQEVRGHRLAGVARAAIQVAQNAGLRIQRQAVPRVDPPGFRTEHREQAEAFYAVHSERSFYGDLCEYMSSSPVVAQVLEGENAVALHREIMGATNPANAADGTIRKQFGLNVQENSVHGSDSPENAAQEIRFFFGDMDIVG